MFLRDCLAHCTIKVLNFRKIYTKDSAVRKLLVPFCARCAWLCCCRRFLAAARAACDFLRYVYLEISVRAAAVKFVFSMVSFAREHREEFSAAARNGRDLGAVYFGRREAFFDREGLATNL